MTVRIEVQSINKENKTVLIQALDDKGKQLLRSPLEYKKLTKDAIEKQLRKELKAYMTPLYGGGLCSLSVSGRGVIA